MPQIRPRASTRWSLANLKLFAFCALVGLIPVISGMFILYWQVDRSLMRSSLDAANRSVAQLDRTVERADDITARAGSLVGRDCAEVLDDMRRLVVGYPAVRALVLGTADRLYCGTEMGAGERPLPPELATMGKLLMRSASLPSPDRASLVFRRYENGHSLYGVIDAQVLSQIIGLTSNGVHIVMEQDGLFLGREGMLERYDFSEHSEHHAVKVSSLYGYRVHSGYPAGYSRKAFKAQAFPMLGTLLLLGVMTGGVCHWLARRPERARR